MPRRITVSAPKVPPAAGERGRHGKRPLYVSTNPVHRADVVDVILDTNEVLSFPTLRAAELWAYNQRPGTRITLVWTIPGGVSCTGDPRPPRLVVRKAATSKYGFGIFMKCWIPTGQVSVRRPKYAAQYVARPERAVWRDAEGHARALPDATHTTRCADPVDRVIGFRASSERMLSATSHKREMLKGESIRTSALEAARRRRELWVDWPSAM